MSRGNGTGYIPDKSNLKSSTRALALIQLIKNHEKSMGTG